MLARLTQELKDINYWSEEAPSEKQLNSRTPFAADCMSFEAWLQFIFIPKMQHLVDNQLPLPTSMAIAVMAETVFAEEMDKTAELVKQLQAFDSLLNLEG